MIASLRGRVLHRDLQWLILDIQGVGYQVLTPTHVAAPAGSEVQLFTSLQVREDSLTLYGFPTLSERAFFELLLTVSGVGPKSALAIMSIGSVERIHSAIIQGDPTLFESVSGIGKKAAAKIIVELKGKLGGLGSLLPADSGIDADLLTALEALGYRRVEILTILTDLPADLTDMSVKIRWALKRLGG